MLFNSEFVRFFGLRNIIGVLGFFLGTIAIPWNAIGQMMFANDAQFSLIPANGLGSTSAIWSPSVTNKATLGGVILDPDIYNWNTNASANVQGNASMVYTSGNQASLSTTVGITSSSSMALNYTVVGYPSLEYGKCNPWTLATNLPENPILELPINIANLPLNLWLVTQYTVTDSQNSVNWDFAYDVWVLKSATNHRRRRGCICGYLSWVWNSIQNHHIRDNDEPLFVQWH
jgi:hypothetical protein